MNRPDQGQPSPAHDTTVRVRQFTSSVKLYLLNSAEVFFAYYTVASREESTAAERWRCTTLWLRFLPLLLRGAAGPTGSA